MLKNLKGPVSRDSGGLCVLGRRSCDRFELYCSGGLASEGCLVATEGGRGMTRSAFIVESALQAAGRRGGAAA